MFHVHGSKGWEGPWSAQQIRNWIADGTIAADRAVWSRGTGQMRADAVPAPRSGSSFFDDLLKIAVVGLGVYAVAKIVEEVTADPETRAIRREAEFHVERGADVRADIPGWPRPPKLGPGRSIPDVHADYGTHVVAVEYENERSVERSHAEKQRRDFATWASRSPRRVFYQEVVAGGRGGRR